MHDERIHTVLILDAQPIVRLAIRTVLDRQGFNIVGETACGEIGLHLVRRHVPDIIILDPELPDLDGLDMLATLGQLPFKVPVVVFSSLPRNPFATVYKDLGAAAFLSKKASASELLATITSVIQHNGYISTMPSDLT